MSDLAYIRRGLPTMPAELVLVRCGVKLVAELTDAELARLARQALAVLPEPSPLRPQAAPGASGFGLGEVEFVQRGGQLVGIDERPPHGGVTGPHHRDREVDAGLGATGGDGALVLVDVAHDAADFGDAAELVVEDGAAERAPRPDVHFGGVDAEQADPQATVHQQGVAVGGQGAAGDGVAPLVLGSLGADAAESHQGGQTGRDNDTHGGQRARPAGGGQAR